MMHIPWEWRRWIRWIDWRLCFEMASAATNLCSLFVRDVTLLAALFLFRFLVLWARELLNSKL